MRTAILNLLFLFITAAAYAQVITTVAGTGKWNGTDIYSNFDGNVATATPIFQPLALAIDDSNNLYFADVGTDKIYKVSANGIITHFSGTGKNGNEGDGGPAVNAPQVKPHGLAADHLGNIYIADYENCLIRKVDLNGIISTIAGSLQHFIGFRGEGDEASTALLNHPNGIAIDDTGNIFFADAGNNMIRKISVNGIITTIAGTGIKGYSGDDGPATAAQLNHPWGVAVDDTGNIYIADDRNNVIRKIDAAGTIRTIAGTGDKGYKGDNGPAIAAELNSPWGLAADRYGYVYVVERNENVIRQIDPYGIITTIAGNGQRGFSGDGGLAINATLNWPTDVKVDKAGNIYITDYENRAVRKISALPHPVKRMMPDTGGHVTVHEDVAHGQLLAYIDSGTYYELTITDIYADTLITQKINAAQMNIDVRLLDPGRYYINFKGNHNQSVIFIKN